MSGSTLGWNQTARGTIGNTLTSIDVNPTRLGGYYVYNPNASVTYLQIFDATYTSDVTLGTTPPVLALSIPATAGANLDLGNGIQFRKGIVIAFTTTATGSTGPASNCDYNLWFY